MADPKSCETLSSSLQDDQPSLLEERKNTISESLSVEIIQTPEAYEKFIHHWLDICNPKEKVKCCHHDRASPVLVDIRSFEKFKTVHLKKSGHMPYAWLEKRASELPPRGSTLSLVGDSISSLQTYHQYLSSRNYTVDRMVQTQDEFWSLATSLNAVSHGTQAKRMWQPSPCLGEYIDRIESHIPSPRKRNRESVVSESDTKSSPSLPMGFPSDKVWDPSKSASYPPKIPLGVRVALDLACGTGRDAVFLALRGWHVIALDHLPRMLDRCAEFAVACGVRDRIHLYCYDIELEDMEPITGFRADLINVSRYLHRPLFPALRKLVHPGGAMVYHTFMVGCEKTAIGRPRRPQFLLQEGELEKEFPHWKYLVNEVKLLADQRPTSFFVAIKPFS